MPGLLHIGVGLGAKKWAPKVPVFLLVIAAEFTEILFFLFLSTGLEKMPAQGIVTFSPYSHSLVSGVLASLLFFAIVSLINGKRLSPRDRMFLGLLTLSHILLDILASPKTAFFPNDGPIPIFLNPDYNIGLGLWRYRIPALILEYGGTAAGLWLCLSTVRRNRKKGIRGKNGSGETE